MSYSRTLGVAASLAVLLAAAGCQEKQTPVEPDPVYPLITESFSGTIEKDGRKGFPFTVTNPGRINTSITSLSPVSTLTMGLGLGAWDATAETCTEQLQAQNGVRLNVVFGGDPPAAGVYLRHYL